ncbi:Ig-like domain-containing protein, partial [Celeribacter neptunius]
DLTPSGDGTVTVDIAGGVAQDAAGNGNTAATQFSIVYDQSGPSTSLASSVSGPTNTSPIPVTVSFTEAVTGFTAADLTVSGGTVSNFAGSGSSYSFDLTPLGDGTVTVDIAGGVAQDTAGNGNTAATQFSIASDQTTPGLTISGMPESFLPGETFTVSFNFAESVNGFDLSDVSVSGASKGALEGGPQSFTMSISPDGTANVTVSVAAGAATDAAGNLSAAASATARIDTAAVASKQIAGFLQNRGRNLVQNQPKLTGFLKGGDGGHLNVAVSRGASDFSVYTGNNGPFWFSLQGSSTSYDDRSGDTAFALAVVGGHAHVQPGLLVGGMIQFDHATDDQGGGVRTSGNGWLAGPYAVMQITDQPIYLEGRLLYGESSNKISPFGTFTDSFKTDRLLSVVALEGQYQAERLRYAPRLQLSYVSERQKAYLDGLSNLVPDQTVRQTELSTGIDFEMPLVGDDNRHLLTWGLAGIWSQLDGKGAASSYIDETEGGRARIDLGYLYNGGDGLQASAKMFLDGIGSGGFTTYGISLGMSLTF